MIVKLKTLEKLIDEFGFEKGRYGIRKIYSEMDWYISKEMLKYLGTEIDLIETKEQFPSYTHCNKTNEIVPVKWYWHASWFEVEEFLDESEFKI